MSVSHRPHTRTTGVMRPLLVMPRLVALSAARSTARTRTTTKQTAGVQVHKVLEMLEVFLLQQTQ
jgi:hypothetical protein